MRKWILLFLAAGLFGQAPQALAETGMKYISTAGDYIGQGLEQKFEPPSASITALGSANQVEINVTDANNWWTLDFAAPADSALTPGTYPDATRYPFNSPTSPGMSMYGDGRGCNTLTGWFKVREYELDGSGNVSKLAIDFIQHCEGNGAPLYGSVRVNSDLALQVPDLVVSAGADFSVISGERAKLDGSGSATRKTRKLTYQWTQLDGPAVALSNPASATPRFVAPDVGPEGARLHFQLQVTDGAGKSGKDNVVVIVSSPTSRRTEVSFRGDAGDYITGGRHWNYNPNNSSIDFSRNYDGGVSVSISGDTWWYVDTAPRYGTHFGPGKYLKAQRYPFQDQDAPGLSLDGDGRGCNTLTGKFIVYEARFDDVGNPLKIDMSFVQHCEGGEPAAHGEILLNAVPHQVLQQRMRAARQYYGTR